MKIEVPTEPGVAYTPIASRLVGIDPGLRVTGYAVVESGPRGPRVIEAGVIRVHRDAKTMTSRLDTIHRGILEVIDEFCPSSVALEQVHSHPRFPRTAILMAHARGVIMLAAALRGIPVSGYAAARIKKSLTGSGKAPKAQMQHAILTELRLGTLPEPHDVADACAVALCHFQIMRNHAALP